MKTVLFVDKGEGELWHSFQQYDFVLDEYQRRGHFEVCDWHPGGMSVGTALPTLQTIVGEEREWTAVVACDLRDPEAHWEHDTHFDNPFDFALNYDKDPHDAVHGSAQTPPLVRLTQMLGGIPDKVDMVDGRMEYRRPEDYYQMLEDYRLGVPRPKQIVCVTPRSVDADLVAARDRDLSGKDIVTVVPATPTEGDEGQDSVTEPSPAVDVPSQAESVGLFIDEAPVLRKGYQRDFWERNDYPPSARFVVCDRELPSKNTLPSEEPLADDAVPEVLTAEQRLIKEALEHREGSAWLHYWVSVLTLVTADLFSDDLKPYRLYGIDIDMDFDGIKRLFDRRYSQWQGAREHVLRQMRSEADQLVRSEFEFTQMPDCSTEITVDFDLVNEHDLMADPDEVGIIRDRPVHDQEVWTNQRLRIGSALGQLLRAPRRALRNAARRFRNQSHLDPDMLEYCILNQTEREELEDELAATEIELAASTGKRAFRVEAYDHSLAERSQEVRDEIERRSVLRLDLVGMLSAAMSVVLGLTPFLLAMFLGQGGGFGALWTTAAYLLILAAVAAGTLWWQQRMLREGYGRFNAWMRSVLKIMHDEADRLAQRISAYATFRKRWSILERQDHLDDPTRRARWLGEKEGLLQERMRDVEQVMSVEVIPQVLADTRQLTWSSISALLEDESFYNVYSPQLSRCPFNEDMAEGITVQVPFEFITSVRLNPVQIW